MRRLVAASALLLVLAAAAPAAAGTRLFAFGGEVAGLRAQAREIDVVAPNWFWLDRAGRSHGGVHDYELPRLARAHGVEVWPVVNARLGFRRSWLRTPAAVARRVARAVRPYDGVTLDVEEVPPSAARAFTRFVAAVDRRIGARGLGVYAVRRTAAVPRRSAAAYRWRALVRHADLLLASTYGEHGPPGPPGPLTTPSGFDAVLRHAQRVSRRRVAPVLAGFAIAWPVLAPGPGTVVPARGLPPGQHTVRIGDRVLWYADAATMRARRAAVRRAGFRWVAMFSLGREPAAFWRRSGRGSGTR